MSLPEVWLRGPLDNIPPLTQPVAHALLQAGEEIDNLLSDFPDHLLWLKPAGVASVGFHLQHMTGVCDRLLTYAEEQPLNKDQLIYLKHEETAIEENASTVLLIGKFHLAVQTVIEFLSTLSEADLTAFRSVGRNKLPSTLIGLLVHIAEHTMRHLGQLLVTAKFLKSYSNNETLL
jgi:uncharacterized damage-inducible protein DinB